MELTAPSRAVPGAVRRAVAAVGAASLLAQVVLLREILASSQGNELVVGLVLALWLLLTGLASALGGWGVQAPERAARKLCLLLMVAPVILLLSLWATCWLGPDALGRTPSLPFMVGASLVALTPACLLGGLAFAWALAALPVEGGAAHLYGAETLGAAASGLLFHVVLAERLSSAWILFVAGAICAVAGIFLGMFRPPRRKLLAAVFVLAVLGVSAVACPRVSVALASARFPGDRVLSLSPSRYGLLAVVARGEQRVFLHDGTLLFTSEDQVAAEESIHLPLLLHPHPRRILLIGGGLGGGLVEALKHKPERLDYAEMDPGVFPLARRFADEKTRFALDDPRVHAMAEDGRRLLREAAGRYDVIIIDSPVPQNALQARMLSVECFLDARRALTSGGILVLVTPGSDTYLDAGARQRHASLLAALSSAFPSIGVSPGLQTILWAAEGSVEVRPSLLLRRLEERGLHLAQVGSTWLFDRLLPFHGESYRRAVATAPPIENRDLRPVVYLFGVVESVQRISPALARAALMVARAWWAPWLVAAGMLGLAVLAALVGRGRATAGLAAASAGAAGMALQLVLLLAFQALRGHLYHALGGLLAAGMAGMAVGALVAGRFLDRPRILFRACAGTAVAGLLVPLAIAGAQAWPSLGTGIILAVTVLVGASTGAVYPVAVHVANREGAGARLYAWDLAGAACSAAFVTLLGIPLLGLVPVAGLAAGLCVAAALASLRSPVAT